MARHKNHPPHPGYTSVPPSLSLFRDIPKAGSSRHPAVCGLPVKPILLNSTPHHATVPQQQESLVQSKSLFFPFRSKHFPAWHPFWPFLGGLTTACPLIVERQSHDQERMAVSRAGFLISGTSYLLVDGRVRLRGGAGSVGLRVCARLCYVMFWFWMIRFVVEGVLGCLRAWTCCDFVVRFWVSWWVLWVWCGVVGCLWFDMVIWRGDLPF